MTEPSNTEGAEHTATLADGSAPGTPDRVLARFAELGIEHHTVEHPAVHTVAEAKAQRGDLTGGHVKNLFLRNRKGGMWLIICQEDRQLDLKRLAERVGAHRFSFASARRLMAYLGVIPGAVTPLAVINDAAGAVEVVVDAVLLDHALLNVHPLVNTMTSAIAPQDLLRFLEAHDHGATVLDLGEFLSE